MNYWVFSAGLVGLFTSMVHLFAGQINPVRPFLESDLADEPKGVFMACWHVVSVTLLATSAALTYVGWYNVESVYQVVIGISLLYVSFAVIFILVGWHFLGRRTLIQLPQWTLLLPIGVLGLVGTF